MSQSFAQVRALIAGKVDALAGFNLVKMPPQYFGRVANTLAHKGFSVDIRSTQDSGERQRRAGVMMQSTVTVSFAFRLRPKDMYPTDYDAALDAHDRQHVTGRKQKFVKLVSLELYACDVPVPECRH